jgi:hypothetical protein
MGSDHGPRPVLSVQVERRHLFVVFDSSSGSAFRLRCLRGSSLAAKIPDPPGETTAPGGTLGGDPLAEFRDLGFGQGRVFGLGVEPEGYLESVELFGSSHSGADAEDLEHLPGVSRSVCSIPPRDADSTTGTLGARSRSRGATSRAPRCGCRRGAWRCLAGRRSPRPSAPLSVS